MAQEPGGPWQKTACILCSLNCGLEVQTGGEDGRRILRVRGDKAHPVSQGYACEKPQRLDYYQSAADRIRTPLRRRADGSFEPVSWETAIAEIAARFKDVQGRWGGESIFYYGGGGQGNHLGGAYADSTMKALGVRYRSNALAQEKTGEFFVNARMVGAGVHGDFEHCEVAVFVGKNPWHSHGVARARSVLKDIANDPARTMIVIDPRRSETAAMADIHLQIAPGTDAWCLAALLGILVQEDRIARPWLAEHAAGLETVEPLLEKVPVAEYAAFCGVPEATLREAARRIAGARSVSVVEDLGLQMSPHSTLGSYLEKLLWILTGNFAKPGANYAFTPLVSLTAGGGALSGGEKREKRSPVAGARIISGLVPCNVIPEEILTDHPKRYRAMLIESGNPAHSLADSRRMREALSSLELLVVLDVATTETTRLAHYVLPSPTQYEKWEATFFNLEFPRNAFHLRRPILAAPEGPLPEPEIHARLAEALGELGEADYAELRAAARAGRAAFAEAFFSAMFANPKVQRYAPVILYRTLGPTLPDGAASAAALWGACHLYVQANPESAARAGFGGGPLEAGEKLFDAILSSPSGVVFAADDYEDCWRRVRTPGGKLNLVVPELLEEFAKLSAGPPPRDPAYPFVLSAGERRSDTANTVYRNPAWRRKDPGGALRVSPGDAAALGLSEGGRARVVTRRGSAEVPVEITDAMRPGHVSLPNGLGVDYDAGEGRRERGGAAPNELTAAEDRDFLAGTPWHKHVPARIEAVG